ncbi:nucleoporin p54-like isoform X2 [Haliotis rubra]|uniref:nucleoporin p54-like isoform X2 n=1 Tax=Haliotis rubra TaxID=36100 RepID=UPI001EE584D5|nr:nucleoporin p54-like isoform X2 [Haliotis rubra]
MSLFSNPTQAFGTNPATTATTGFSFGGAVTTSAPAFGGFGSTATTAAPTGFSGFGTGTQATLGQTTGFSGGAAPATTTAATGFSGFGTNPGTSTTGFSGFGGTAPTTTTASGFGGFGTTSGFGAGTGTTTGFGAGTGTTTGFGAAPGTTGTSTGFGGFGTTGFGGATTGQTGFGAGLFAGGQQPQQQQLQQQHGASDLTNMAMAVSLPQIYGDERDAIIAKWNQLQACWGTGKGYYSQNGMVEFKADNPFCRFKAIGYHVIPSGRNEDGLVALMLKKKQTEVTAAQQGIVDTLHKMLGSKPTLSVCVEGIRPLPEDRTELVIYVLERPPTGPARRVGASDLFTFMTLPGSKNTLVTQLTVENIVPKMGWSSEQLKEYLDKPPAGIDPVLWQQAKLDNPDPTRLIPVPMIGFKEVQRRLQHQQEQTRLHQQRLDVMSGDLTDLQNKHSNMLARQEEYKRKHLELGHRLLQVIVKQEIYRKMGYAIQAEEEHLKVQLEVLQTELNHPTQFKGRLNELMSQIRMQNHVSSQRQEASFQMDTELQSEIKQLLKQQQDGLNHLIQILKDDASDLHLIESSLADTIQTRR